MASEATPRSLSSSIVAGRFRALTLQQPFASALVWGPKRRDVRRFAPDLAAVGTWICIHVGKSSRQLKHRTEVAQLWPEVPSRPQLLEHAGTIVGLARIKAIKSVSAVRGDAWTSIASTGDHAWEFDDVVVLPRGVPFAGQMRLWWVDRATTTRILGDAISAMRPGPEAPTRHLVPAGMGAHAPYGSSGPAGPSYPAGRSQPGGLGLSAGEAIVAAASFGREHAWLPTAPSGGAADTATAESGRDGDWLGATPRPSEQRLRATAAAAAVPAPALAPSLAAPRGYSADHSFGSGFGLGHRRRPRDDLPSQGTSDDGSDGGPSWGGNGRMNGVDFGAAAAEEAAASVSASRVDASSAGRGSAGSRGSTTSKADSVVHDRPAPVELGAAAQAPALLPSPTSHESDDRIQVLRMDGAGSVTLRVASSSSSGGGHDIRLGLADVARLREQLAKVDAASDRAGRGPHAWQAAGPSSMVDAVARGEADPATIRQMSRALARSDGSLLPGLMDAVAESGLAEPSGRRRRRDGAPGQSGASSSSRSRTVQLSEHSGGGASARFGDLSVSTGRTATTAPDASTTTRTASDLSSSTRQQLRVPGPGAASLPPAPAELRKSAASPREWEAMEQDPFAPRFRAGHGTRGAAGRGSEGSEPSSNGEELSGEALGDEDNAASTGSNDSQSEEALPDAAPDEPASSSAARLAAAADALDDDEELPPKRLRRAAAVGDDAASRTSRVGDAI